MQHLVLARRNHPSTILPTMADRNLDHGNAPPATTAQQQHLINLRRMYASR